MANMSYCRYENTYHDLLDAQGALEEEAESGKKLSDSELKHRDRLIQLCKDIAESADELVAQAKDVLAEEEEN